MLFGIRLSVLNLMGAFWPIQACSVANLMATLLESVCIDFQASQLERLGGRGLRETAAVHAAVLLSTLTANSTLTSAGVRC